VEPLDAYIKIEKNRSKIAISIDSFHPEGTIERK
jgi:hypothetical protein